MSDLRHTDVIDTGHRPEPYDDCRCGRNLVCGTCHNAPEECDCSDVYDEWREQAEEQWEQDVRHLDPLTRTLMGLPSGIHCHVDGVCMTPDEHGDADV